VSAKLKTNKDLALGKTEARSTDENNITDKQNK
jgi:hypothetical protein